MQSSARLSSSVAFRKVIAGVSSATTRPCYRTSRGKAHAAPLPAEEPPPKGRKRITVQERRAKIMEFIGNYRASNEGKFPTKDNIRLQTGGSHYTVRKVLSEMVHNAKAAPVQPTAAPVQPTVEVTDPPMQKGEDRVLERQGIPKNEGKVDQFRGTKTESFKHLMNKPDPGNQQREIDANKFNSREDNPKLEESTNTGLLGSLKSFAYSIINTRGAALVLVA